MKTKLFMLSAFAAFATTISAQTYSTNANKITATDIGNDYFIVRWEGQVADGKKVYLPPVEEFWKSYETFEDLILFVSPAPTRNGSVTYYLELDSHYGTGFRGGSYYIETDGMAYPNSPVMIYEDGLCLNCCANVFSPCNERFPPVTTATSDDESETTESVWYADGKLNISSSKIIGNVVVYNLTGSIIASFETDSVNCSVTLPLSSGVYLIHSNLGLKKLVY